MRRTSIKNRLFSLFSITLFSFFLAACGQVVVDPSLVDTTPTEEDTLPEDIAPPLPGGDSGGGGGIIIYRGVGG